MTTSLRDDEMARIKREILDVLLTYGAIPYVRVRSIYDLIQTTVVSSSVAGTYSATAVTAAGPATLTLTDATGYVAGQRVVLDADASREAVTIRSVSGSTISVICQKTHSGTYPVEVESALTIVRGLLCDLVACEELERQAPASAGLKRVDEVEWFGGAGEQSIASALSARRASLRADLATALGLGEIYRMGLARRSGGGVEVY